MGYILYIYKGENMKDKILVRINSIDAVSSRYMEVDLWSHPYGLVLYIGGKQAYESYYKTRREMIDVKNSVTSKENEGKWVYLNQRNEMIKDI